MNNHEFDETFLYQCQTQKGRMRNEQEVDYLFPKERKRYMKKMMLEFLKEYLMFQEEEVLKSYFYDFFLCILENLEQKAIDDKMDSGMHYIGDGYSVIAFRIGKNVITVGRYKNHNIGLTPDERLLNLKLNRTFPIQNHQNELVTIQIMPFVDTKGIREKDVYRIYKHFRDRNYVWMDPKPSNIGRLKEANTPPYPEIGDSGYTYLGVLKPHEIVLGKGEVVLFDIDGIILESEYDKLDWPLKESSYQKRLEKRYQKEKKKRK